MLSLSFLSLLRFIFFSPSRILSRLLFLPSQIHFLKSSPHPPHDLSILSSRILPLFLSLFHFFSNLSLQFSSNLRPSFLLILSHHHFFFLLSPHVLTSSLSPASFLRIFCLILFLALLSSVTYLSQNLSFIICIFPSLSKSLFSFSILPIYHTNSTPSLSLYLSLLISLPSLLPLISVSHILLISLIFFPSFHSKSLSLSLICLSPLYSRTSSLSNSLSHSLQFLSCICFLSLNLLYHSFSLFTLP